MFDVLPCVFAPHSSTDSSEAALVTITQELCVPFPQCSPAHSRQSATRALYEHPLSQLPQRLALFVFFHLIGHPRPSSFTVSSSTWMYEGHNLPLFPLFLLSLGNIIHFQKFKNRIYSRSFSYLCRSRYPDFWTPIPYHIKCIKMHP